jgi:NitT/TauT family transport system ATP-binding protein
MFPIAAANAGADVSKIEITNVAESALVASYLNGMAPAMLGGMDDKPAEIEANGGKTPVILNYADYGVYQPGYSIVAHRDMVKDNPDLVKRFVKGTLMAVKEAKANPDESIQSLINWVASTSDDKEKKQAREVLDVTLSILYSPNNKDKRLGLNVAADWARWTAAEVQWTSRPTWRAQTSMQRLCRVGLISSGGGQRHAARRAFIRQAAALGVPVTLRAVRKVYSSKSGEVNALGPIDLDIASGRFVSLLGPSGCGKSTLLLMIAGLLDMTDGEIDVAGKPVQAPLTDVGIVFQGNVLVDWRDTLGNVLLQIEMMGRRRADYEERARNLLSSVGLQDFAHRFPYELSGGMQQRTAFCRALIHDPPLILMDEPLGALDAMTREQLRGDLERLWMAKPKTVVFVTHSIEEAVQLSDEVVVISPRPGTIVRRVAVDLPRPRNFELRQGAAFQQLVTEIKQMFVATASSRRHHGWTKNGGLRERRTMTDVGVLALFVLAQIVAWEAAVRFFHIKPYILPTPSAMAAQFVRNSGRIFDYTLVTAFESLVGLALAILVGVPLALMVAFSPFLRRTLYPEAVTLEMVPKIALAPVSSPPSVSASARRSPWSSWSASFPSCSMASSPSPRSASNSGAFACRPAPGRCAPSSRSGCRRHCPNCSSA